MSRMSTPDLVREKIIGSPCPQSPTPLTFERSNDEDEFEVKDDDSEVYSGKGFDFSDISNEDLVILDNKECLQDICDFLIAQKYSIRVIRAALNVYFPLLNHTTSSVECLSEAESDVTIRQPSPIDLTKLSGFIPIDSNRDSEQ